MARAQAEDLGILILNVGLGLVVHHATDLGGTKCLEFPNDQVVLPYSCSLGGRVDEGMGWTGE